MKRFTFIAVCFALSMAFAVSASAQVPAATTTGPGKIGLVNVNAFSDEKAGIAKFRTALASLDAEFKPAADQLNTKRARYQTLAGEIQKLQQPAPTGVPAANNQATLSAKVEEAQNLEIEIKRLQEDLKNKSDRRSQQVVGPVYADIVKSLSDFAKQKGYAMILDGAKLEEAGILIGFDDKYDVTKEFIAFYNARPAGTATTATPK
ncbi:MAG: OmpH family outer membrane protein [Acidobacteria bacterium]|nr:OmpH family outer membrane protein [Acidobacteriota bacterium]